MVTKTFFIFICFTCVNLAETDVRFDFGTVYV